MKHAYELARSVGVAEAVAYSFFQADIWPLKPNEAYLELARSVDVAGATEYSFSNRSVRCGRVYTSALPRYPLAVVL